jgi:hypothetical protein
MGSLADGRANSALRNTVSSVAQLANILSTFNSIFEPYISLTQSHYQTNALQNVRSSMSAVQYVDWVLAKVIEEDKRARACLSDEVALQAVKLVKVEAGAKMSDQVIRKGRRHSHSISVYAITNSDSGRRSHGQQRCRRPSQGLPIRNQCRHLESVSRIRFSVSGSY